MTGRIFQTLPTQTDTTTVTFPGLTENDLLWADTVTFQGLTENDLLWADTVTFPGLTENDLLWAGVCPGRPALPYPCPALFIVTDRQTDTTFTFIYKMEEGEYS